MSVLDWSGHGFDLSLNADAPLADWVAPLQRAGSFAPKGVGPLTFDCWGLVAYVQRLLGRRAPSYADAYTETDFSLDGGLDRLVRAEAEAWVRAPGAVGDVLVAARCGAATHVAVLCGAGCALHALATAGLVVTHLKGRARVTRLLDRKLVGCVRPA